MIRTSRYRARTERVGIEQLPHGSVQAAVDGLAKRLFDIIGSLLGLVILSPLFVLIAALIKRDSHGPVFYWGPRMGRDGAVFRMLKFRTMHENARSYQGPRVTGKDDPRITPVGRWLRDTKLNELPQLWNVLVGDMSLVGPRPEDPILARTWPARASKEILSVRPGITSPASVIYRDEENMLAATEVMRKYLHELSPDKLRLDQLYVCHHSFLLDLDVIFWTFVLLLPKIRSYSLPEHLLFAGPITRLIKRYIRWFLSDFGIVLVSMASVEGVARLFGPLNIGWDAAIGLALAFAASFSLTGIALGIDRIDWRKSSALQASRLWATWLAVVSTALAFQRYTLGPSSRLSAILLAGSLLALVGIVLTRYQGLLQRGLHTRLRHANSRSRAGRTRVLIVGSGRTAEHFAWLLQHPTYAACFQVEGFIDDDPLARGMRVYSSTVLGSRNDIGAIIQEHRIGLVVLADSQLAEQRYRGFRDVRRFSPARVVVAPDIFGSLSGLQAADLEAAPGRGVHSFQCRHCVARVGGNGSRSHRQAAQPTAAQQSNTLGRGSGGTGTTMRDSEDRVPGEERSSIQYG